jgi:DNA-binding CsgD family transcriptional regulator
VAEGGAWLDPAVTGRVLAAYREGPARQSSRTAALDMLTAREREVLALIGAGRTNGEIARELLVGEGTVNSHVNHVFAKPSLRDRAAAVILAWTTASRPRAAAISQADGQGSADVTGCGAQGSGTRRTKAVGGSADVTGLRRSVAARMSLGCGAQGQRGCHRAAALRGSRTRRAKAVGGQRERAALTRSKPARRPFAQRTALPAH